MSTCRQFSIRLGEIRGQAQGAETFLSSLDGGEEVPPVDTLASGDAFLTLTPLKLGWNTRLPLPISLPTTAAPPVVDAMKAGDVYVYVHTASIRLGKFAAKSRARKPSCQASTVSKRIRR